MHPFLRADPRRWTSYVASLTRAGFLALLFQERAPSAQASIHISPGSFHLRFCLCCASCLDAIFSISICPELSFLKAQRDANFVCKVLPSDLSPY